MSWRPYSKFLLPNIKLAFYEWKANSAHRDQRPGHCMSAERRRLAVALLFSLLMHTLLLGLTFGGQALGLPGFAFPWRERRIEAPDLRVVLMPAQVTAAEPMDTLVKAPPQPAPVAQTVSRGATPIPSVPAPALPGLTAVTIAPTIPATAPVEPAPLITTSAVADKARLRTEVPGDAASTPIPAPRVIAVERSSEPAFVVPLPPPTPAIEVAPAVASTEAVMPAPRAAAEVTPKQAEPEVRERVVEVAKPDPAAREVEQQRLVDQLEKARNEAAQREAARQEAARVEAARLETQHQEVARLAAAKLEAQRLEVALQAAARIEAVARIEAARAEAARQEMARVDAARQEAQRQQAARLAAIQEAQRQAAARIEGATLAAAQLEADRQAAVRQAASQEAARIQEEKAEDAKRDARRQAMGRQLNEEAAQRDAAATAARAPSTLPLSLSTARRFRLWGRSDPNVELVEYAEAWARKIQFNSPVDTVREVAKRPHTNPMVTVAIRSDGSVESVTFALSSGVAEVDEAIRRIVQSSVPYPAFPPGLAREFDVIEVRRTWHFDTAIRMY